MWLCVDASHTLYLDFNSPGSTGTTGSNGGTGTTGSVVSPVSAGTWGKIYIAGRLNKHKPVKRRSSVRV